MVHRAAELAARLHEKESQADELRAHISALLSDNDEASRCHYPSHEQRIHHMQMHQHDSTRGLPWTLPQQPPPMRACTEEEAAREDSRYQDSRPVSGMFDAAQLEQVPK